MVANHFHPCVGGMERVVGDMSRLLTARGHEVSVVCLDRCANSDEPLPKSEELNGIRIMRIPFLDLKYYKAAPKVLAMVKDVDVVHVHGIGFFSDFLLLTRPLHKKPVVVSTHGGVFHTKSVWPLKTVYFNIGQRLLLPAASGILAVSKNDLEMFSKIARNVTLLENGIDIKRFGAGKKKQNSFIFVGRFSRNKKIEGLLRAFSMLGSKDWSLTIAGNDWEGLLEGYLRMNVALGIDNNVKYVRDPTDGEIAALYSSHEFFVSASEYEGFGLSLAEAMASGCIPIVQENNGHREVMGQSECGLLIDFAKASEAAGLIEKVMGWGAFRKKHLREKAVERAGDFSWERRIPALEKLYESAKEPNSRK